MPKRVIYQEGDTVGALPHTFLFDFESAGLNRMRAAGITRFIEFWCQLHCQGRWRIIETTQTLQVGFDRGLDVVFFQLSEEYSRFASSNSIIQCPHSVS